MRTVSHMLMDPQGTYAILPERLPAVPGGEGVGEVIHVGDQVELENRREIRVYRKIQ